jgi:acyl-ACP thioesterase
VSNDDTRDAGLTDDGSWVVRRTELVVQQPPRFLERVALATWCGGTGSRWAERRVSIRGVKGGRVESASL